VAPRPNVDKGLLSYLFINNAFIKDKHRKSNILKNYSGEIMKRLIAEDI
jgi:hypothetical protein